MPYNYRSKTFILLLAITIGISTGLVAWLLKLAISSLANVFLTHIHDAKPDWWLLITPAVGIILTGIFSRYIVRENLEHGTAQLKRNLRKRLYKIRRNRCISPLIGCSLTLGFGGSAGAEGPIASAGAAIGSNIGQYVHADNDTLKTFIGCGASGGIAAIFAAPIGGLMFSLELLRINLNVNSVLMLFVTSLTSYLTISALTGFSTDLSFTAYPDFEIHAIPMVILLGLFCGAYSIYYTSVTSYMDAAYSRIRNPWIRNLSGGLMLGATLLMFPSMYGTGYPIITDVINEHPESLAKGSPLMEILSGDKLLIIAAICILLCICWAVSASNSSGGVAGDFAPTIFAGSMAGFIFATMSNQCLNMHLHVGAFSYIGMAGVMAGAIQAPLMAIFIILEMTQSYHFALPLTICAIVSYITTRYGQHILKKKA